MIIIRMASTDDAALIADMSRQTFYETFASHNTQENMDKFMSESFTKDALMKEVGELGNIFFVAYDDDEPVGYVRMRESIVPPELINLKAIEIARIYVTANTIGKGVGKAMMLHCINIAKEGNYDALWLGVWEYNHKAIEFYTRLGFEKFGTHVFMLGNDAQTDWLMIKTLNPV